MAHGRALTPQKLEEVQLLWDTGKANGEIATQLGVTTSVISQALTQLNISKEERKERQRESGRKNAQFQAQRRAQSQEKLTSVQARRRLTQYKQRQARERREVENLERIRNQQKTLRSQSRIAQRSLGS